MLAVADCPIAPATTASPVTSGRSGPNINPVTGLSTDYLNHFTEAIMLLELLPADPDCVADFLEWEPKDYRAHFAGSHFSNRNGIIAAYETAELSRSLDMLTDLMNTLLLATHEAISANHRRQVPRPRPAVRYRAEAERPARFRPDQRHRTRLEQPRQCPTSRDRCYVQPVSTAPDLRAYPDRPFLAVSAAIIRDGRVLVARRARGPALGIWTMPGGVVEAGETLAEALVREIAEETAMIVEPVALAGHREVVVRDDDQRVSRHFVIMCFATRWISGEPQLNEELAEARWLKPEELAGLKTTEGLAEIVAAAFERMAAAG